jgi:5-methylcytosine-specific restriction endonuclease McrA
MRANRERDPEQKRQRDRQYYERNRDKVKARVSKYYQTNRDAMRAYATSYARKHPEKLAMRRLAWYQANRDRARAAFQRRRARKRSAGGSFTAQEWRNLCAQYGNRCLCCGSADTELTIDHVIPLVMGGRNDIENIQPLCLTCNLRKARKAIDYRGRARSCQS